MKRSQMESFFYLMAVLLLINLGESFLYKNKMNAKKKRYIETRATFKLFIVA